MSTAHDRALSPERSIATQKSIGADIMMVLDQCVPVDGRARCRATGDGTHASLGARSLAARGDSPQALFGIVQGACYTDLRIESARTITQLPFDGFAIGGLAVGESVARARGLHGDGDRAVAAGSSALPDGRGHDARSARSRTSRRRYVRLHSADCAREARRRVHEHGPRDLRRAAYRDMEGPLDPACGCYTCKTYSIAYLFHLQRVHETQGWQLLGLHNIHFYMQLMRTMREHILAGTWLEFYQRAARRAGRARQLWPQVDSLSRRRERREQQAALTVAMKSSCAKASVAFATRTPGEVMHSVNDPAEEARSLYVEQSRRRRAAARCRMCIRSSCGMSGSAPPPMRWRRFMAVEAMNPDERKRRLVLVSFENDLDSLKLALRHTQWFKHLRHAAPDAAAGEEPMAERDQRHRLAAVARRLRVRKFDAPPPDIVFFDPFSFKTDSELWTLASFRELAECAATKRRSCSPTPIRRACVRRCSPRASMLRKVGQPDRRRKRRSACRRLPRLKQQHRELLGAQWLAKWERSDAQAPFGASAEDSSWRTL